VLAVDANPRQNHLLELKLAGIRGLGFADFFALFGDGGSARVGEIYGQVRHLLGPDARLFWDRSIRMFDPRRSPGSFYYGGTAGFFALMFRRYVDHVAKLRTLIERMMAASVIEEQLELYFHGLRPRLLTGRFLRMVGTRGVLALLGVPAAQRELVAGRPGGVVAYLRACPRPRGGGRAPARELLLERLHPRQLHARCLSRVPEGLRVRAAAGGPRGQRPRGDRDRHRLPRARDRAVHRLRAARPHGLDGAPAVAPGGGVAPHLRALGPWRARHLPQRRPRGVLPARRRPRASRLRPGACGAPATGAIAWEPMDPSTSPAFSPDAAESARWGLPALERFYRFQAPFYDWTRPFFLYGRRAALRALDVRPGSACSTSAAAPAGTSRRWCAPARGSPRWSPRPSCASGLGRERRSPGSTSGRTARTTATRATRTASSSRTRSA
jgi:hypothetical protein